MNIRTFTNGQMDANRYNLSYEYSQLYDYEVVLPPKLPLLQAIAHYGTALVLFLIPVLLLFI